MYEMPRAESRRNAFRLQPKQWLADGLVAELAGVSVPDTGACLSPSLRSGPSSRRPLARLKISLDAARRAQCPLPKHLRRSMSWFAQTPVRPWQLVSIYVPPVHLDISEPGTYKRSCCHVLFCTSLAPVLTAPYRAGTRCLYPFRIIPGSNANPVIRTTAPAHAIQPLPKRVIHAM